MILEVVVNNAIVRANRLFCIFTSPKIKGKRQCRDLNVLKISNKLEFPIEQTDKIHLSAVTSFSQGSKGKKNSKLTKK